MLQFVLLVSIAAVAQSSATTITISSKGSSATTTCGSAVEGCIGEVVSAPSAEEIQLLRDSWLTVRKNKNVFTEFILEHYRVHPKTQALLPELANIALADLPSNAYFVKLTQTYIVMGMQEIIDNLDNAGVLTVLLECLHPEWYVDYVSIDSQNEETLRILFKVLDAEMGDHMSEATRAAWVKGMNYANSFLKMRQHSNVNSVVSTRDINLVRKIHAVHRDNTAIATKALMLMFTEHPESQKLVPALAGVPLNELESNQDFLVLVHTCSAVADFIVSNLDNEKLLTHILIQQTKPEQFVSYISPIHQLDETAHVVMQAIEQVASPDAATKEALKNVMDYVNGIIAQKMAPNSDVQSVAEPIVTAQEKTLIRATWDQMMFNSEVAPKFMLRLFSEEPQIHQLFDRLNKVPTSQLMKNKDFYALSYSAFSGINFVVQNMEDPTLMIAQIVKMVNSKFFGAPSPTVIASQSGSVSRMLLEVFREEVGAAFTQEAAAAWTSLFKFVSAGLEKETTVAPITADEHHILTDNVKMIKKDSNFGSKVLYKHFIAHPRMINLFPQFANIPIQTLNDNAEFIAFGKVMMAGFEFFVDNLNEPTTLRRVLANRPYQEYFVSYVSIPQQLEETARLIIDALDEELGVRFTSYTRGVWSRAFHFANSIMAESFQ